MRRVVFHHVSGPLADLKQILGVMDDADPPATLTTIDEGGVSHYCDLALVADRYICYAERVEGAPDVT